jgi:colicin import membrane protein
MNRLVTPQRQTAGLWLMTCCSAVLHLIVYVIVLNFHFPVHFKEAPIYYVDVINLPVANPQAGTPGTTASLPAQPQPEVQPRPREMTLPAKSAIPPPARQAAATPTKTEAPETGREFEERIARLEHESGARHAAAALEASKNKVSKGTVGMPGATGSEAGSDYASYIHSRLMDAFKTTIALQSKNPEVVMRITISRAGRILRIRMERSSGDKIFEDAVSRAIVKAEKSFVPPPKGVEFETGFVFRPQGIVKN